MKILVAIESSKRPRKLSKTTLRWAPRAGYDLRIFIPDETQREKYIQAIDNAKYDDYLDLQHDMLIIGDEPLFYAKKNNYDLLVLLPDDLKKWTELPNLDAVVLEYAGDIGFARSIFGKNLKRKSYEFANGARIIRV